MKNSNYLKLLLSSIVSMIMISCNNHGSNMENEPDTTTKMAVKKNDSTFDKVGSKDAKELVEIYNSNMFEATLSDSVQNYSKNADVKTLASTMAKAHKGLNEKIQSLAALKLITLPSGLDASDMDKVQKMVNEKDAEMNKDYVNKLVLAHQDVIARFAKDSSQLEDVDMKSLIISTLPELRMHLNMAQSCEQKMKSMKK